MASTSQPLTIGEAVQRIRDRYGSCPPAPVLSMLFYRGVLDGERCPTVCGRRQVPEDCIGEIVRVLRRKGLMAATTTVESA